MEYYNNYKPCRCSNCRNYYKQIKGFYLDICEYLETLGIDPLKPFELVSFIDEKTNISSNILACKLGFKFIKTIQEIHENEEIEMNLYVLDLKNINK